ncbi:MAG: hypothetical protein ACQEVA_10820 [Myxococcota bacterium]
MAVISVMMLICGGIACGPDEPDEREVISGSDTGMMDTSETDGGDSDTSIDGGGDAGEDADADRADSSEDTDSPPTDLCDAENIGVLTGNTTTTGSFGADSVTTTCGVSGGADGVIRFELDEPARVQYSVTSAATDSLNVEIHSGDCSDSDRIVCYQGDNEVFLADDGLSYYLVVESGDTTVSSGDFEVEFTLDPLGCFPSGETECDGDDVLVCGGNFEQVSRSCAYACEAGACGGDLCENAIEVSGTGTQTFQGSLAGYTDKIDFAGRDECFEAGAISTDGADVVFSLPGLAAGDVVTIDASEEIGDINDNAIFVVSDCSATPTCVTGGDQLFESLEWTVESGGDYWVVVDLLSAQSDEFSYEITVE